MEYVEEEEPDIISSFNVRENEKQMENQIEDLLEADTFRQCNAIPTLCDSVAVNIMHGHQITTLSSISNQRIKFQVAARMAHRISSLQARCADTEYSDSVNKALEVPRINAAAKRIRKRKNLLNNRRLYFLAEAKKRVLNIPSQAQDLRLDTIPPPLPDVSTIHGEQERTSIMRGTRESAIVSVPILEIGAEATAANKTSIIPAEEISGMDLPLTDIPANDRFALDSIIEPSYIAEPVLGDRSEVQPIAELPAQTNENLFIETLTALKQSRKQILTVRQPVSIEQVVLTPQPAEESKSVQQIKSPQAEGARVQSIQVEDNGTPDINLQPLVDTLPTWPARRRCSNLIIDKQTKIHNYAALALAKNERVVIPEMKSYIWGYRTERTFNLKLLMDKPACFSFKDKRLCFGEKLITQYRRNMLTKEMNSILEVTPLVRMARGEVIEEREIGLGQASAVSTRAALVTLPPDTSAVQADLGSITMKTSTEPGVTLMTSSKATIASVPAQQTETANIQEAISAETRAKSGGVLIGEDQVVSEQVTTGIMQSSEVVPLEMSIIRQLEDSRMQQLEPILQPPGTNQPEVEISIAGQQQQQSIIQETVKEQTGYPAVLPSSDLIIIPKPIEISFAEQQAKQSTVQLINNQSQAVDAEQKETTPKILLVSEQQLTAPEVELQQQLMGTTDHQISALMPNAEQNVLQRDDNAIQTSNNQGGQQRCETFEPIFDGCPKKELFDSLHVYRTVKRKWKNNNDQPFKVSELVQKNYTPKDYSVLVATLMRLHTEWLLIIDQDPEGDLFVDRLNEQQMAFLAKTGYISSI